MNPSVTEGTTDISEEAQDDFASPEIFKVDLLTINIGCLESGGNVSGF